MAEIALKITHVATDTHVEIYDNAFALTEYSDNVSTKYNAEQVFGRMDPITTYQGTERKISFAINLKKISSSKHKPGTDAFNRDQAKFAKAGTTPKFIIRDLMAFQYPTYKKQSSALSIARPPLVRVYLKNFLDFGNGENKKGLLCAMDGFAFTPMVGFTPENSPLIRYGKESDGTGTNLLDFANVSCKFSLIVLHEHELGFVDEGVKPGSSIATWWMNSSGYDDFGFPD